jgi:hypothetical protein
MGRKTRIFFFALTAIIVIVGIAAVFYWRGMRSTPEYSLALLIDAARRDDGEAVGKLVDINSVVDDFMPQITGKAMELYGRGLPAQKTRDLAAVAAPILPAVKDRARAELPGVIRERTSKFEYVPFAAIVFGADRYLNIEVSGDLAEVTSKLPDRPLAFRMKRSGDGWQIVGIRDDRLAESIARTVGQQIIAVASGATIGDNERNLGVKDLQDILKQAEKLLR